jgi:hypothetical protein
VWREQGRLLEVLQHWHDISPQGHGALCLPVWGNEGGARLGRNEGSSGRRHQARGHAMTKEELAQAVLRMFEAQAKYFKSRDREDLIASKKLEIALVKQCREILLTQARMF